MMQDLAKDTKDAAAAPAPLSNAAGGIVANQDLASYLQEFDRLDPRSVPSYLDLDLDLDVPTDDDYLPRQFRPVGRTIQRLHDVPRGPSNTNDIVALATRFAPSEAAVLSAGYENDTASEYVRGIVVVSVAALLLYVIWAATLLILRCGRLGEWRCFGRRCCTRGVACVESTRARGGCCGRNVCGWMAGRVPKRPTEASLKRDAKIQQSRLIRRSNKRSEVPPSEEDDVVEGGDAENDDDAETREKDKDDVQAEADIDDVQNEDAEKSEGDSATDIVVSKEYLAMRRRREERSMKAIRIVFLLSGTVVLAACVVLCFAGFRAIDNLLISTQESLVNIDEYFTGIIDECDTYIQRSEEVAVLRSDFLEGLASNNSTANATGPVENSTATLCPNSGNGPIEISVNLGELFDGPLFKLAEVKSTVTGKVENLTVVSFLDQYEVLGSVLDIDIASLRKLVVELVSAGKEAAKDVAADTSVSGLLETGTDAAQGAVGAVGNVLPEDLPNVGAGGERNRRYLQEEDSIFAIGGDGASFEIIGNATEYKERDLSALLATNVSFSIDFVAIANQINERLNNQPAFFLLDTIETLRDGAANQRDGIRSMDDTAAAIRPYWYIAVIFASFLMVIVILMMVACALAWAEKQPRFLRCLNDGCILPTFIVCGMLLWVFTCVFLCLGIISADLCINTPDNQINGMLEIILEPLSPIAYNFAKFYLTGCNPEDRPLLMDLIIVAIAETREAAAELFNMLSNLGPGYLGRACGSDFNSLRAASYLLSVKLDSSLGVIASLGRIILCKSFHPLYSSFMYKIFCTDVIGFLGPMMISLGLISSFSMVMVTLRVAWHELEDDIGDDEDGEGASSSGCCCRRITESGKGDAGADLPAEEELVLPDEGPAAFEEVGEAGAPPPS